jgi:hypothetical protein
MEGVPLDLASRLLPARTWLSPSLLLHVHLHAQSQKRHRSRIRSSAVGTEFPRKSFEGLLEGLAEAIERLDWRARTTWSGYETNNAYSQQERSLKTEAVERWLSGIPPGIVLDLGSNTGKFSELAASLGHRVVALDGDFGAADIHYRNSVRATGRSVTILRVDLRNLSAGQGWAGRERSGLVQRLDADAVLALALIHHLCLTGHLDLERVATFMASLAPILILEWVPLEDPQAIRLVGDRKRQFERTYNERQFTLAFGKFFHMRASAEISDSGRRLFRMERKSACGG